MDKQTLSNYGLILVATIVVVALLAVLSPVTPFGESIRNSINGVVDSYIANTKIEEVETPNDDIDPSPIGDKSRTVTIHLVFESGKAVQDPIVFSVNHGDKLDVKSKIPTIDGYTPKNVPKEQKILRDTSFSIIYVQNLYSIVYETNGGTIVSEKPTSYFYGETVELPTNVVKQGYYFAGWYDNKNLTGDKIIEINANVTGDKILYARWEKNAYRITYISNGSVLTNLEAKYTTVFTGDVIDLPVLPAQNGQNFGGWYNNKYFSGASIAQTPQNIDSDMTYYAYWTNEGFNINYITNGGNFTSTPITLYKTGTALKLPTNIVKPGYNFAGWYTSNSFTTKVEQIGKTEYGNKTFYAKWTEATYNIVYDTNGGVAENLVTQYTFNESKSPLKYSQAVTKNGYDFIGWKDIELGTIQTEVAAGRYGDIALIAQFAPKTYAITYDANGGYPSTTVQYIKHNNPYGNEPTVARDGYEFAGWYTAASGGTKIESTTIFNTMSNRTLYAHWTPATYNIVYEKNGGTFSTTPTSTYTHGTAFTLPTNITKPNYNFAGWYTSSSFTTKITAIPTTQIGDTTVYAKWSPKTYTITYDTQGGTLTTEEPSSYVYGSGSSVLPTPKRSGYQFNGWIDITDGDITNEANYRPIMQIDTYTSGNRILKAYWTEQDFRVDVKLVDEDGDDILVNDKPLIFTYDKVKYNTNISIEAGYLTNEFGLSNTYYHNAKTLKYTEQQAIDADFHITETITCYKYRKLNIVVYFVDNDNKETLMDTSDTPLQSQYLFKKQNHETATISIPEYINDEVYKLYSSDLGSTPTQISSGLDAFMGAKETTTLTIKYKINSFPITYVMKKGSTTISIAKPSAWPDRYIAGNNITLSTPTATHYTFINFTCDSDEGTVNGNTITTKNKAITINVNWDYTAGTTNHSGIVKTSTKAATCLNTGYEIYDCPCGHSYTKTLAIDSSNHEKSTEYVGTAAIHTRWACCKATHSTTHSLSATKTSSECRRCACGYVISSHSYTNTKTSGVCRTCSQCSYQDTGHDYANTKTSGVCRTCSTCKYEDTGHDYGGWSKQDDTYHKKTCSTCTYVSTATHSWSTTTAATCTATGTQTCSTCKATKSISKTSHTKNSGSIVGYAFGWTDYCYFNVIDYKCSVCSTYMSTSYVGATGHTKAVEMLFGDYSENWYADVNGSTRRVMFTYYKQTPEGNSSGYRWLSPNKKAVNSGNTHGIKPKEGTTYNFGCVFTSTYNGSGDEVRNSQSASMAYSTGYDAWRCGRDFTLSSVKYYCRAGFGAH